MCTFFFQNVSLLYVFWITFPAFEGAAATLILLIWRFARYGCEAMNICPLFLLLKLDLLICVNQKRLCIGMMFLY